ncbi:hypothetical protein HMPREF9134_01283 [Porphyromonas catoniae F0037]|uniref:Uncharacterized protein n=1 Tax=Porphyromonas catoniae F0037 TaxID=1127696 RepID=L1NCD2_9PORP|nr:hypothetical protein HMPREF9134_01283 [Porphyromonas catoniae F0037]
MSSIQLYNVKIMMRSSIGLWRGTLRMNLSVDDLFNYLSEGMTVVGRALLRWNVLYSRILIP